MGARKRGALLPGTHEITELHLHVRHVTVDLRNDARALETHMGLVSFPREYRETDQQ